MFIMMSIRSHLREEKDIENRMLTAPKTEFTVYYQPKVDLATGKSDGCAEALVRWQSQAGAIILRTASFLYSRENMIDRLDQYV